MYYNSREPAFIFIAQRLSNGFLFSLEQKTDSYTTDVL